MNLKIDQDHFWKIFNKICHIDGPVKIEEFLSTNNFKIKDFENVCTFLDSINHSLDIREKVINPLHQENMNISLKMSEWVSLQALFPKLSAFEHLPYFGQISKTLSNIESENTHLDIFEFFKDKSEHSNVRRLKPIGLENDEIKVGFLEEAIIDKSLLEIKNKNNQHFKLLPLKLVFIGGELELIYQELGSQCLASIEVANLDIEQDLDHECETNISSAQLESFITNLRDLEERSIRLVLKINSLEKFELKCKGESFSKSCIFSNPEGQKIWAATIEPSEQIYQWLLNLQDDVQILSPNEFKKDFLEYCEKKVAKLA